MLEGGSSSRQPSFSFFPEELFKGRQAGPDGEPGESGDAADTELSHDVLAVGADSLSADAERGSDLLGALPLGQELEHLSLPGGQQGSCRELGGALAAQVVFDVQAGNVRGQVGLSLQHQLDRPDQLGEDAVLQEETSGADLEHFHHQDQIGMH